MGIFLVFTVLMIINEAFGYKKVYVYGLIYLRTNFIYIQTVTYASNTKVSREIFNITLIYWSCEPMYWYQLPMFNINMPHDA